MEFSWATRRAAIHAAICFAAMTSACESKADLIAEWTFEISPPTPIIDSATFGPISADSGTGEALGVHASALTNWTTPAGNLSDTSLASSNWAIGDFYQFSVSTLGFFDTVVSWDQSRSSTGPATFDLAYSVDGGTLFTTAVNDYPVPQDTWLTSTFDLSSVTAVDGLTSLVFRLVAVSSPGGTTGTNRVDNFLVQATAVPEPGAILCGSVLCGVIGLGVAWRRITGTLASGKSAG